MIRRPPRSTPSPTRRSSDLAAAGLLRRELDVHPEPPQQRHDRLPRRGEHRVVDAGDHQGDAHDADADRKSTRLNSSHANISYAVFCLKKKKTKKSTTQYYYQ